LPLDRHHRCCPRLGKLCGGLVPDGKRTINKDAEQSGEDRIHFVPMTVPP
jgi:hypothetical protein